MVQFLYKLIIIGEIIIIIMTLIFEKISQNNRYGYARFSFREEPENSSLESENWIDVLGIL
jgi:hypothetical protein